MNRFPGVDFADFDSLLSEEQRLVRESVRGWVEDRVKPVIEEQKPLFREFSSIDYRRVFELSPGIDVTAIKAELKNGVLAVHLPKSAAIKPRKIQIAAE